jgi:hypothetical protein
MTKIITAPPSTPPPDLPPVPSEVPRPVPTAAASCSHFYRRHLYHAARRALLAHGMLDQINWSVV